MSQLDLLSARWAPQRFAVVSSCAVTGRSSNPVGDMPWIGCVRYAARDWVKHSAGKHLQIYAKRDLPAQDFDCCGRAANAEATLVIYGEQESPIS